MARVTFYGANQSPSPAMVCLFMSRTGIEHDDVVFEQLAMLPDFGARTNRNDGDYIAMNPTRCVPTVVIDSGEPLFECSAILKALAMTFHGSDSDFYPVDDVAAVSRINSYLDWHLSSLRVAWHTCQFALMSGDSARIAQAYWGVDAGLWHRRPNGLAAMVELFSSYWVGDGPFLCGRPTPSIADFAALAEMAFIELFGTPLSADYLRWRTAMFAYMADDPAWTSYRDDAVNAVLVHHVPPPPENTTGYPFDWFGNRPVAG